MFVHITDNALKRGVKLGRAQEMAARTVNKRRRREGRTPNTTTQGTGNPNLPLEQRTRDELYQRAKQLDIKGRSYMRKAQLIEAIRQSNA